MSSLIVVPARLTSTRLVQKPLALLHDKPLLWHVLHQAKRLSEAAGVPLVAAVDQKLLAEIAASLGVEVVMTDPDLPSGTDRVHQALQIFDPQGRYQKILNLQGDMVSFPQKEMLNFVRCSSSFDITTLMHPISAEEAACPSNVKVVHHHQGGDDKLSFPTHLTPHQIFYFSRALVPSGAKLFSKHVGVYLFQRKALETFCAWPPSYLEKQEKLEQLRALEGGLSIGGIMASAEGG